MESESVRKCGGCGYDLHGLEKKTLCPECGTDPRSTPPKITKSVIAEGIMSVIDRNIAVQGLAQMPDVRKRVRSWMLIAAMTVSIVGLLQLAVTFAQIPIGAYRLTLMAISFSWPFIVVGMLPAAADASMPPMYRMLRPWIPVSQWCWLAGYALWLGFHVSGNGTLGGNLGKYWPILLLHLIGGIGVSALAFWLHDFALRLKLNDIAKNLNLVAWAYITWGCFVFLLPWKHFAAANLQGNQGAIMWWAYIIGLMFPWLFVQFMLAKSLFAFASIAQWDMHYEKSLQGRQERIREKREAMDKENDPFA